MIIFDIMKILEKIYGLNGIAVLLIKSDSGNEYIVSIDGEYADAWCSCPYYTFKKSTCKHIMFALNNIDFSKLVNMREKLENLRSGCLTIDELMGGGFPFGIPTAITGLPSVGKTWLAVMLGVANIKKTGMDSVYIDTEGNREKDILSIAYKLADRYEVSKEEIDKHFKIISTMNDPVKESLEVLCNLFGYNVTLELSSNGKYSVTFAPLKVLPIQKYLQNATYLAIDSLTTPLKESIGHETQNLPARSSIVNRIYGRLLKLSKIYNLCSVITHHVSVNPVNLRDLGRPYGGDAIIYHSKYILQILPPDKKAKEKFGDEARRVQLIRRPDVKTDFEKYPVRLKLDYGFTDE